jgi:two-component system sensor histidine kinase BaeS
MRGRLLWKLLGINILTITFVIVIVWVAVDTLAADYFAALMKKYGIEPVASHKMFLGAIHRYLIWASLAALFLTTLLSFLLMKKTLSPLTQMTSVSRKIASGDYSDRVPARSKDEVGQLASAFNHMAESLDRIEGLRKRLMIDVAHELRTPLTNLKGYLEALIDRVVPPSTETFELLQEEVERLIRLVEDILRLARADAARGSLTKMEIHLPQLLNQMVEAFRPLFREKGIQVEASLPEECRPVSGDPDKVSEVINNLLQNAWQYTPDQGRVWVRLEQRPEGLKALFGNTGGGLKEKDLPFIFERFYRGEESRSRDHGGAGIGLAIVKELVEAHGGRVGAELSDGETLFWFTLPG